jgi:hypothetical protein
MYNLVFYEIDKQQKLWSERIRLVLPRLERFRAKWIPVQGSEFSKSMPSGLTRGWVPVLRLNSLQIIEERVFFMRTGIHFA